MQINRWKTLEKKTHMIKAFLRPVISLGVFVEELRYIEGMRRIIPPGR
jgi:hypothetical protein